MNLYDELKKSPVFSELSDKQLKLCVQIMAVQTLKKGEILFKQNDMADALYLVLSGALVAILTDQSGKQHRLSDIGPAELVGEMGVINSQPRTVTVSALKETTVALMKKADFEELYEKNPQVLIPISHLLIKRMRSTLENISEKQACETTFLLVSDSLLSKQFLAILDRNAQLLLVEPETYASWSVETFLEKLEEWENSFKFIIVVLPVKTESALLNRVPEFATRIMVLVNGYVQDHIPSRIIDVLEDAQLPKYSSCEIIYFHSTRTEIPNNKNAISLETDMFTRRHHVILDEPATHRKFMRFLIGKPIGLVISGGGTRVWSAVGAVQYLLDRGIEFDAVGGTSSGSIVAAALACHSSGYNFNQLVEKVLEIDPHPLNIRNFTYPILSLLNGVRGTFGLQRIFENIRIEDLLTEFFSISCSLTTNREVCLRTGKIWEAIRASVSLPGIYPPFNHTDLHELLVDGGIVNNLPTDQMQHILENRGQIIAIDLTNTVVSSADVPNLPTTLTFYEAFKYMWRKRRHPEQPNIFDVLLNSMLIASEIKSKSNRLLANVLITPKLESKKILSQINRHELIFAGRVAAAEKTSEIMKLANF